MAHEAVAFLRHAVNRIALVLLFALALLFALSLAAAAVG
jgi:hypothetical protein